MKKMKNAIPSTIFGKKSEVKRDFKLACKQT
jgi:hypothetical protein